jgi:hypothetical protein
VHKDIARAVVQSDESESLDIIEVLDLATAAKAGLDELATVEGLSDITKSEHSELKYILTYIEIIYVYTLSQTRQEYVLKSPHAHTLTTHTQRHTTFVVVANACLTFFVRGPKPETLSRQNPKTRSLVFTNIFLS